MFNTINYYNLQLIGKINAYIKIIQTICNNCNSSQLIIKYGNILIIKLQAILKPTILLIDNNILLKAQQFINVYYPLCKNNNIKHN